MTMSSILSCLVKGLRPLTAAFAVLFMVKLEGSWIASGLKCIMRKLIRYDSLRGRCIGPVLSFWYWSYVNCKEKNELGDKMKGNQMSWECRTYGMDEKCMKHLGQDTWRRATIVRPHLKWRIILKQIFNKQRKDISFCGFIALNFILLSE